MEPVATLLAFCTTQILTQGFVAGLVGNFVASVGYDLSKSGANNLGRRLGEVWQQGGRFRNHDLMRALLFAESQAAVAVCEICLLEDYKTQPTLWRAFALGPDLEPHLFNEEVRLIARAGTVLRSSAARREAGRAGVGGVAGRDAGRPAGVVGGGPGTAHARSAR